MHTAQTVVLVVELPPLERILRAEREFPPTDLPVVILRPERGFRLGSAALSQFVNHFKIRPSVNEKREHFGKKILERVRHIIKALFEKLSRVDRRLLGAPRLDPPLDLSGQSLEQIKDRADRGGVVRHFAVNLRAVRPPELREPLLRNHTAGLFKTRCSENPEVEF